ncbi:hypothetical protein [Sulfodiicoccus acidiphilus]|nr:hypothetical protein [Sulfodiicoccus acidiphilus]
MAKAELSFRPPYSVVVLSNTKRLTSRMLQVELGGVTVTVAALSGPLSYVSADRNNVYVNGLDEREELNLAKDIAELLAFELLGEDYDAAKTSGWRLAKEDHERDSHTYTSRIWSDTSGSISLSFSLTVYHSNRSRPNPYVILNAQLEP